MPSSYTTTNTTISVVSSDTRLLFSERKKMFHSAPPHDSL